MAFVTIEEYEARQSEIRSRLQEIDHEYAGQALPDATRTEWNTLSEEHEANEEIIEELRARQERVESLHRNGQGEDGASFLTPRPGSVRDGDIFDLTSIRASVSNPDAVRTELVDRARTAVEKVAAFPHTDRTRAQEHVLGLLEGSKDRDPGLVARHLLATGSPAYKRAFGKALAGQPFTSDEAALLGRALSLTGSAGGFAVPFDLDPTIIPTSNLAVNPFRAIARVEQITVDEWRGISSGAITAQYRAEATEATDNAPTLAQPTVSTEKADAFIPFSIEVGQDWTGLQAEMAKLLQDSKDELEAVKFVLGTGTNEPQGVIVGATTIVTASGTASFAAADLDTLEGALPARFQPNASLVLNRAIAQKIRRFDTAGGANIWLESNRLGVSDNQGIPSPGAYAARVLGYPAYESSAMDAVLTTGSEIAVLGDFRYYLIADRIGLTVEVIQHLMGANRRPTGQRGIYAYWRNGAGVLSPNAFRVLRTG